MDKKVLMRNKLIPRSQPSSPFIDPLASATASSHLSPLRSRKSYSLATESSCRSQRQPNEDTLLRSRWPSSSSSSSSSKNSSNSLADYLHEDSLSGFKSTSSGPQSLSSMRSCSDFPRFEENKEEEEKGRKISKEHRPFGSSMRYIGKLKFQKSSSKPDSSPSIQPGRMSVDENALASRRKTTDFALDFPSSESDRSDSMKGMSLKIPRARPKGSGPKLVDRNQATVRRSSSLTGKGPGLSPWALSPGRRSSSPPVPPPVTDGGVTPSRSFSGLRPASPDKSKKVGSIISIGLDLFRRKSGSTSNKLRPSSPVLVVGDTGHQFRMLHNCLIQWRFVNAKSNSVNQFRTGNAEV